jgi:3-hydroxypropanoate dehydrogenase
MTNGLSDCEALDDQSLDRLFREARSFAAWSDARVSPETLTQLYDLAKFGPTSTNCCPARFVFLTTPEAKNRLLPTLWEGNREKASTAPVTAIVAMDTRFHELVPQLFHHRPEVVDMFTSNARYADETAQRNSALQGAYMIFAARALGLDCGPMSGFDADKVNSEFFPDGRWQVNFMINLGYGDRSSLFPRLPRPDFATACRIL